MLTACVWIEPHNTYYGKVSGIGSGDGWGRDSDGSFMELDALPKFAAEAEGSSKAKDGEMTWDGCGAPT